jgi:hypothetical protein
MRVMTDATLDEHTRELIQGLCLEAGRIMEDTSAELALILPESAELVVQRVARLLRAAEVILALANAAAALADRSRTSSHKS